MVLDDGPLAYYQFEDPAESDTLADSSGNGVGDLATTCFSPFGRNRTCGERLGRGESLDDVLGSTVSVVEGVPTTRAVADLARQHDVDMPITNAVHAVLFERLDPMDAIWSLMQREAKAERVR